MELGTLVVYAAGIMMAVNLGTFFAAGGRAFRMQKLKTPWAYRIALVISIGATLGGILGIVINFLNGDEFGSTGVSVLVGLFVATGMHFYYAVKGIGVHLKSGFRPGLIRFQIRGLERGTRQQAAEFLKKMFKDNRLHVIDSDGWGFDVVARTSRDHFSDLVVGAKITGGDGEPGGITEIRIMVDVEDILTKDTKESGKRDKKMRQIVAMMKESKLGPYIANVQFALGAVHPYHGPCPAAEAKLALAA